MRNKHWNILLLVVFIVLVLTGLFYVFYSGANFDEGNFLYKGYLYSSGAVKPYTPNFTWSEYMPGGYILFGFSQLVFGKSFYAARFVSFFIGFVDFFLCYLFAKKIAGKTAAVLTLVFMVTNIKMVQSFSAVAVYSFSTFFLLLFFLTLISNLEIRLKSLLSLLFVFLSIFFRSSLIPSYVLAFIYIIFINRKSLINVIVSTISFLLIPCLMLFPFMPGIFHVFFEPPIIRDLAFKFGYPKIFFYSNNKYGFEKIILSLLEFFKFHQVWFTLLFVVLLLIIFSENRNAFKKAFVNTLGDKYNIFIFLIVFFIFNLFIHFFGSFSHCPRCSMGYFYYYSFASAIILGSSFAVLIKLINANLFKDLVFSLSMIYVLYTGFSTMYNVSLLPFSETSLQKTEKIALDIKNITKESDKIFTVSEPHYLYLSDRRGFWPLINKEYGLRLSSDSKTLSIVGNWNQEMAEKWLDEANWAIIDENNLLSLRFQGGEKMYDMIMNKIGKRFSLFKTYEDAWPSKMSLYKASF